MYRRLPLLLSLVILTANSAAFGQGMPPTLVETETVQSMEFHNQITLVGRTEAVARSRIVAEVSGRVVAIDAPEGNAIRSGEILVSIDARRIRYALDAKRAEVAQAKAQSELSDKDLERAIGLFKQDLISEGRMDADQANATRAQEWHKQKLAEQKQLELDLANCSIRAPYNGFTARKLIDVGEWVGPGTPVYQMVDLSTVKVIVDLPERYFGHVVAGSAVSIVISGTSNAPVTGIITGVAPSASGETHTFPVIVTVDNHEGRLGGGMLVRAVVSLDEVFTSLSVSKDAIVRQGAQTMVYTVTDGMAMPIMVVTGSTSGEMIAVSGEGLAEGMPVIVRGNERVFPNSPVRVEGEEGQGGGEGAPPVEESSSTESGDAPQSAKSE